MEGMFLTWSMPLSGQVIQEVASSVYEGLVTDTKEQMRFASDCGGSVTLSVTMNSTLLEWLVRQELQST